jgi:hypothetical protein
MSVFFYVNLPLNPLTSKYLVRHTLSRLSTRWRWLLLLLRMLLLILLLC